MQSKVASEKGKQKRVCLPSDPARNRYPGSVGTGLGVWWTVAVRGRSLALPHPNQNRVHRTRLHLTPANDGLRPSRFAWTPAPFCSLVHVQLARLRWAPTAADTCARDTRASAPSTTTPGGTLNSSPHALHSTTCVQLKIAHPTPPEVVSHRSANLGKIRTSSAVWNGNSTARRDRILMADAQSSVDSWNAIESGDAGFGEIWLGVVKKLFFFNQKRVGEKRHPLKLRWISCFLGSFLGFVSFRLNFFTKRMGFLSEEIN